MSTSGRVVVGGYFLVAVAVLVSMLMAPDPYPFVILGCAVALLVALALPLPAVTGLWGALLPIWSLGSLPPVVFDAARLGLGLVILMRCIAARTPRNPILRGWVVPLGLVATLTSVVSWWRGDDVTAGLTMLASVALVGVVLWRLPDVRPLFTGFAVGAGLSAVVLVATALAVPGIVHIVPNADPGYARFTGLGTSAPRVSTEFAATAVICWATLTSRGRARLLALGGMLAALVALALCGGRTGVAGLAVAAVVILVRRWVRPALAVVLAAGMAGGAYWLTQRQVTFNTLDRLTGGDSTQAGFSTGRSDLLREAWDQFAHAPILGPGGSDFLQRYGVMPHFPPLSFAITGGVVAGLVVTVLTVRLARLSFRPAVNGAGQAGCLVAAVLLAPALLDPDGPFIGVEMLALLLGAVVATAQPLRERGPLVGVGGVLAADVHLIRHTGRAPDHHDLAAQR